jgi:FkbM family methyltransferase
VRAALGHATDTCVRIWRHPENKGRRLKTLGLYFAWQAWERTVKRPWTIPLVPGRVIRCYPHCQISSGTLYYRLPERSSMRFLLDYLRPGDTMVDVGANAGTYSLLATTIDGVSVLAFEPSSVAYERAETNMRLNGVDRRVQLRREAAGATSGVGRLSIGLGPCNKVLGAADEPMSSEEVAVVALDDLLDATGPVSLMKIDVEGGELDVLAGAQRLIRRDGPVLIVEVNDPAGVDRALTELGYSFFAYDVEARRLAATTAHEHRSRNVIAVRDLAGVTARLERRRVPAPAPSAPPAPAPSPPGR